MTPFEYSDIAIKAWGKKTSRSDWSSNPANSEKEFKIPPDPEASFSTKGKSNLYCNYTLVEDYNKVTVQHLCLKEN